jgi:hypothetical protein
MTRGILSLGGVLLAVLISAGLQRALFTPPALFLTPEATGARVAEVSLGQQVIAYDAPGSPYAWRHEIASRLEGEGWVSLDAGAALAPQRRYARTTIYPLTYVLEQVDLFGGPNEARIVRRWRLVFVTWRLLELNQARSM